MSDLTPGERFLIGGVGCFFVLVLLTILAVFGVALWAVVELVLWVTSK